MGKILVVDDQFGVRSLLVEIFQGDQHEVETAADGAEALGLLKLFEPDLILMDIKMPGMNGIETLGRMRELECQAGVIMMTAYYGDLAKIKQAKDDLGILNYMSKPFDLFELRERVRKIFNRSGIITKGLKETLTG